MRLSTPRMMFFISLEPVKALLDKYVCPRAVDRFTGSPKFKPSHWILAGEEAVLVSEETFGHKVSTMSLLPT